MKLTKTERWILSNQYKVLEALYTDDPEYYAKCRKVLEQGYELDYNLITQYIYDDADIMSEDECNEVINILAMFSSLGRAYRDLEEKPDIKEAMIKFDGFDGNNETKQMSYARFFCSQDGGRFQDLDRPDDFNSHSPVIDGYRRMLDEWEKTEAKYNLTPDEIIRISSARIHGAA